MVMCRFAHECLERMVSLLVREHFFCTDFPEFFLTALLSLQKFLSQKLEVHLGPDTAGKFTGSPVLSLH